MACTTQTALKYITGARSDLVKELKNLSVILENLNQQKVLSDEEVCVIEAEQNDFNKRRKILDSVIRKGEAACYEFLRIVYVTRKRTVWKSPLLLKKTTVASAETKTFDLHHWISCFSFNEDTQMDTSYLKGM